MFFFEWVVPLLLILSLSVCVLYLAIRCRPQNGPNGYRTDGRTVVDKPEDEAERQEIEASTAENRR